MGSARAQVFVDGDVQGVNFRAECARNARRHSLGGWVRNLADGRVEALFEGNRDDVEHMLEWCRQGPVHASVRDVEVVWEAPTGADTGFRVVR